MTETLADRLIRHEGLRTTCYYDSLGYKTIGVGHLVTPDEEERFGNGITRDEALDLLEDDITKAKMAVARYLPWTYELDDARKEVLWEMCFQLGIQGLLGFKRFLADVRAGDWENAAKEMLRSKWHRQTPGRSEELAEIMRGDVSHAAETG